MLEFNTDFLLVYARIYYRSLFYRIAGYFRGANISRLAVLVHFAVVGFKYNRRLRDRCYNITPTFFRD